MPSRFHLSLLLALLAPAASAQEHADHAAPPPPPLAAPVEVPLDAAQRQGLPQATVSMQVHGTSLTCSGVDLVALLRKAGAMPEGALRGAALSQVVEIRARDSYRVLFSLAELDPGTGNRQAVLADQCDGKPLDTRDGPLRLLVPGDVRPARSARQVEHIRVLQN